VRRRHEVPGRPGWSYGTAVRYDSSTDVTRVVYHERSAFGFRVTGPDDAELIALARRGIDHVYAIRSFHLNDEILTDDLRPDRVVVRR
jgi:hypothetical protein